MSEANITKLTDSEYFAIDAVNASRLKAFRKAPILSQIEREETAAMRMGSLVHCAILEPNLLESRYTVTDLDRRGTKAWDAEEAAAKANNTELVKKADWQIAMEMRDAVWKNAIARECLDGCEVEVAARWTDPVTGLACKAKADAISRKLGYLIDVKTTTDAHPNEFKRQFAKLGYWLQETYYRWGFAAAGFGEDHDAADPTPFIFISVEKERPHLVSLYEMAKSHQRECAKEMRSILDRYAACAAINEFPGYPDYNIIQIPSWAISTQEEERQQ